MLVNATDCRMLYKVGEGRGRKVGRVCRSMRSPNMVFTRCLWLFGRHGELGRANSLIASKTPFRTKKQWERSACWVQLR